MVELTVLDARCYVCGHLISGPTTLHTDKGQAHPSCVNCSPYVGVRIAELEAKVERLTKERDDALSAWAKAASSGIADYNRAEALSRTSAVKVKALEWSEYETDGWADRADAEAGSFGVFYNIDIQADGYRVVFDHEAVGAIGTFDTADEAKAAAQADYERRIRSAIVGDDKRILSALEPATPEGEQEPVQDTWFTDRALPVMAMSGDAEDNRVLRLHFRRKVTDEDRKSMCDALNLHQQSLTRPSEQAAPEGRQEPVAWPKEADKLFWSAKEFIDDWKKGDFSLSTLAALDAQSIDDALVRYSDARARPAEQAVTEAMVEAAADEIVDTAEIDFNGTIINRLDVARAAIKAAMEAGR